MHRLCMWFDKDITGQSMQASSATSLVENSVAPHIIQGIGRWTSAVWQIYIHKCPILLQAMLHAWTDPTSHRFTACHAHCGFFTLDTTWSAQCPIGYYLTWLLFFCFSLKQTWTLSEQHTIHRQFCILHFFKHTWTHSNGHTCDGHLFVLLTPHIVTSSSKLHTLPRPYRTIGVPWWY